eukprot:gene2931-3653_t
MGAKQHNWDLSEDAIKEKKKLVSKNKKTLDDLKIQFIDPPPSPKKLSSNKTNINDNNNSTSIKTKASLPEKDNKKGGRRLSTHLKQLRRLSVNSNILNILENETLSGAPSPQKPLDSIKEEEVIEENEDDYDPDIEMIILNSTRKKKPSKNQYLINSDDDEENQDDDDKLPSLITKLNNLDNNDVEEEEGEENSNSKSNEDDISNKLSNISFSAPKEKDIKEKEEKQNSVSQVIKKPSSSNTPTTTTTTPTTTITKTKTVQQPPPLQPSTKPKPEPINNSSNIIPPSKATPPAPIKPKSPTPSSSESVKTTKSNESSQTTTKTDGGNQANSKGIKNQVLNMLPKEDISKLQSKYTPYFPFEENKEKFNESMVCPPLNANNNPHVNSFFERDKKIHAVGYYKRFNKTIFKDRLPLPENILEWSDTHIATPGKTIIYNKDGDRLAKIILSSSSITSMETLANVICHEMCHSAVWMFDGKTEPHRDHFKYWSRSASFGRTDPLEDSLLCSNCKSPIVPVEKVDSKEKESAYETFRAQKFESTQKAYKNLSPDEINSIIQLKWKKLQAEKEKQIKHERLTKQ